MRDYIMKWNRNHVEVFDAKGQFLFSADTEQEALAEMEAA